MEIQLKHRKKDNYFAISIQIDTPLNANSKYVFFFEEISEEKYNQYLKSLNDEHFGGEKAFVSKTTETETFTINSFREKYICIN